MGSAYGGGFCLYNLTYSRYPPSLMSVELPRSCLGADSPLPARSTTSAGIQLQLYAPEKAGETTR